MPFVQLDVFLLSWLSLKAVTQPTAEISSLSGGRGKGGESLQCLTQLSCFLHIYVKGTICHQAAFLLPLHIWDFQLLHLMQWAAALFSSGDVGVSLQLGHLSQWRQYLLSSAFLSAYSISASCKACLPSEPCAYLSLLHSHSSMVIKDPLAEVLQQG